MIEDRLRAGYAAFNRGDFDEAIRFYHPDVEIQRLGGQGPIVGADEMRAWMEPDAWAEQTIEPVSVEVAGRRALILQRTLGRAAGSGIEIENDSWAVVTLDDDLLVTRVEVFFAHEEKAARAAAGIPASD